MGNQPGKMHKTDGTGGPTDGGGRGARTPWTCITVALVSLKQKFDALMMAPGTIDTEKVWM